MVINTNYTFYTSISVDSYFSKEICTAAIAGTREERKDLFSRLKNIDLALALALIHHLRITNNLPMNKIVEFFKGVSKYLIIEFVDKTDSKVKQMLMNRKDIFDDY